MSIETDLYTTLSTNGGVTAICSDRIYPLLAPDDTTLPYVTYQMITGERLATVLGVGDAKRKRIQISCHASIYSGAKDLSTAVEAALEGDGYLSIEPPEFYDPSTQVYTAIVDWSFMAV